MESFNETIRHEVEGLVRVSFMYRPMRGESSTMIVQSFQALNDEGCEVRDEKSLTQLRAEAFRIIAERSIKDMWRQG